MTSYLVDSNGNRWVPDSAPPPSSGGLPDPVEKLEGTEYGEETPGRFGRLWDDRYIFGESRTKEFAYPIQFTNMIWEGKELYFKDGKYRVKGKPVVDILGTVWEPKLRGEMGDTVFGRFQKDGYWCMDNGPTHMYCLYCGCNLVHELKTLYQGGLMHSLLEAQDYDQPIDHRKTPRNSPHLFHTQVLVSSTASRDYNILCDRGAVGGNGRVKVPVVVKNKVPEFTDVPLVGMEQYKIAFFPRPPFVVKMYRESLVVDNVWRTPGASEGVEVTVSRLLFNGGDVYGLIDGKWYPMDIMLVRGSYDTPSLHGDMDDRRVFVDPNFGAGWKFPPGAPDIGWTYKHSPADYPWPSLWRELAYRVFGR